MIDPIFLELNVERIMYRLCAFIRHLLIDHRANISLVMIESLDRALRVTMATQHTRIRILNAADSKCVIYVTS